ncbi:hypothetical protein IFM89_006489 [Coptis chinensis]|uniref:Protein kinase domain-containing protein n=1 Tax=Coptis chinensis TaxID=261450 RepID=A0A835IMM0_9MAGN|nr:hypothetical protein IFM89_006489 [Coptis chinensis]
MVRTVSSGYALAAVSPLSITIVPSRTAFATSISGLIRRLGKRVEPNQNGVGVSGTAYNMAPESVRYNEFEPHSDIWAFGISVLEMLIGEHAWTCGGEDSQFSGILRYIGYSDELPEIPTTLSSDAQDFV